MLTDHKHSEIALMEELCHIHEFVKSSTTYPVVFSYDGANYVFTIPDFPEIQCKTSSLEEGTAYVQATISEALSMMPFPPPPSLPSELALQPGQFCLSITL